MKTLLYFVLSCAALLVFVIGSTFVYTWVRFQYVKNCEECDYGVDTTSKPCYNRGAKEEEHDSSKKPV